ncbi:MAG: KTSC domain-containing protein [bacterium]
MVRVESSTIHEIGYADEARMLFVRFRARGPGRKAHPGWLYRYVKVPRTVWTRMQRASSHGQYLADHVKGKYGYAMWTGHAWRPEAVLKVMAAQAKRKRAKERQSR